ncbi:plasmid partitioning protein RepA [Pseudochrobactrum asaccharolyticum]|uniref:Chromosome partitioning protein n=1 Tax=Pseudochrobactrum asaccharolyticum TaxID=354351 RepID=A0A366DEN2_9HYPH|nr:plasmid partitioning protein RepA [Pseudochrobactrum asaccharolyticum]RBO87708.1 chromosome partitioning protein [Pseudochrobactrum asaccharolyticum]
MDIAPQEKKHFARTILAQGEEISSRLDNLRVQKFPPNAQKTLRQFTIAEVSHFIGVSQSYIKKLHLEGKGGVEPETSSTGRRSYTAQQMHDLQNYLERSPRRKPGDQLKVISVVNFKGGSGKTTTAAHLAQHLALTGHRTLAIDLDPQASLTALHGIQPELDRNLSYYDSLRYDDERKPLADVIRKTNFPLLDIVPANLELQEYEYDTPLAIQQNPAAGRTFYTRIGETLAQVDDQYDVVVIDCPPQLGYLTLTALTASTSVLITVHPQMLDLMSMSQFLLMLGGILTTIEGAGVKVELDWFSYLVTRFEPADIPQAQMVGFMQSMLAEQMLKNQMLKTTAISDAGLTKQTLYEVERSSMTRSTYDRAWESAETVNSEITSLIHKSWGRN